MRIENIEIQNFRQYRSLKFKFPCNKGKNDLHIIFAKNKAGKTNVLNAITWCLYDTEMHLGDKDTAEPRLNKQYAHELRENLGDGESVIGDVTVKLLFVSDDGKEKIQFQRIGKFNITKDATIPVDTSFSIMQFSNSEWNSVELEEDVLSLLKKTVPEEIHDYIFFDGEHLDNYFKAGQLENVRKGIEELTQAKIIEKSENAFQKYIQEVLNPQISNSSVKDISDAQKKLDEIQSAIDSTNSTISDLKTQIHLCDDEISKLDNVINGHVSVSEKTSRLKDVEQQIDIAKAAIEKKDSEIMLFVREYVQYFALYPSIKSLYLYIQEQDKHGKLPPRIDKFLLESIEKHNHCCICDQDLNDHSFNFIHELKKELEVSSETSALLNRSVTSIRQYLTNITTYKDKRDALFDDKATLQKNLDDLLEEEKQLNTYLMNVPNAEAITEAIKQKKEYKSQRDIIIANKALEEEHLKDLNSQYSDQDKKLQNLFDKNKQYEKVKAQIEYCRKCRNILKETRTELLDESRSEMEKETFDTFIKLMWQKDEYSKVEILEDYTFRLLNNYGEQTLGSCSAAERALLALSFTLSLQKVSMHDSLLFIDTPLGRVDDDNRLNFISTLCNISKSKQVILTFTPTEYDDKVKSALVDQYSSFTKLSKEDGVTKII